MFARSNEQAPHTPGIPEEMALNPEPSSKSRPQVAWSSNAQRESYFQEEEDVRQGVNVPLVLEYSQRDATRKIRIRMLRLISRLAATAVAIPTAVQEGMSLFTYATTRNIQRDGRGPWAKHTRLWPSILLFSVSVITAFLGIVITIAYMISIKAANKVSSVQDKISITNEIGHVLVWVGVAIAYRMGKNGKDLWGWACSPIAEKIQPNFESIVHFDSVCSRGRRQFGLSIAAAVVNILSLFVLYMVFRRLQGKKELKRISASVGRPGAY